MAERLERHAQIKVTEEFLLDLLMLPEDMKILDCSIEKGTIRFVVEHDSLTGIDPVWDELPIIICDAISVIPNPRVKFDWDIAEGEGE